MKLKWEKIITHGQAQYYSGIYKITSYQYARSDRTKKHWQCFYITPRLNNWGDYVDRSAQLDQILTLAECKAICNKHATNYEPSLGQKRQSLRALDNVRRYAKEVAQHE